MTCRMASSPICMAGAGPGWVALGFGARAGRQVDTQKNMQEGHSQGAQSEAKWMPGRDRQIHSMEGALVG